MSNKKGVGVAQVFIFILAAISFALIMIFGYKAISGFLQGGQQVEFIQFKTDLETSIQRIYTEFGAVRIEQFHAPVQYTKICFVDLGAAADTPANQELKNEDPLAFIAWESVSGTGESERYKSLDENVFLTPTAPTKIKVHNIKIRKTSPEEKDYLCLPINNGAFSLRLEGRGSYTELAETSPLQDS